MDWNFNGNHVIDLFDKNLSPERLRMSLYEYRDEFGDNFTIHDLIRIYDIHAKIQIAAAITDAPEYLLDQIGKADGAGVFEKIEAIGNGLSMIAESIESRGEEA